MTHIACQNCGFIGKSKRKPKGSTGVELILWFCFLIPGLIYSLWRQSTYHPVCPKCGSEALVPVDSPRGKEILTSQGKTLEEVHKSAQRPPLPLLLKAGIAAAVLLYIIVLLIR